VQDGVDQAGELVAIVREVARAEIVARFRALAPTDISTKSGPGDLVTVADRAAEAAMTAAIRALMPEATVVGEEAISADPALRDVIATADPCVIIDPVDGTWNFAKGLALFGVLVAVTRRGRPVWGMLYDPLLDDWIIADADGTRMVQGDRVTVLRSSIQTRTERMVGFVPVGLFPRSQRPQVLAALAPFSRATSLRCACHEYRLIAQGHAEFALSGPVQHAWDHAAGVLAVEQAGGVARFLDGAPYDAGRRRGPLLVAASEPVWDQVAAQFGFLVGQVA
jgi:fructose-1,6-bisphosphatase/inositol monophosphatase family enzyme